jgi:hypothetical protein
MVYIVCLGRRNTCGGYHWRFADEEKEKTAADLEESAAVRFGSLETNNHQLGWWR